MNSGAVKGLLHDVDLLLALGEPLGALEADALFLYSAAVKQCA